MRSGDPNSFLHRYNPAVPRRWLLLLAGVIWTGVGLLLCGRAIGWLSAIGASTGIPLELCGVLLAVAGYRFGFSKIVRKNARRIWDLPERACVFAFTAWRGYFMIGLMITMGILLRNSPLPKVYLILPYTTMGGVLLLGSLGFYRRFAANVVE